MDLAQFSLKIFQVLHRGPTKREPKCAEEYQWALGMYGALKSNPENFCTIHILQMNNEDPNIRQLAMTLFAGKMFELNDTLYLKLSPNYRDSLNTKLLDKMASENMASILHQYVNIFEKLYSICITNSIPFPQFLPSILHMCVQGDREHQNYCLNLLEKIIVSIPPNDMKNAFDVIVNLVNQAISSNDGDLMSNAMSIIKELIQYANDNNMCLDKAISLYPILHQVTLTIIKNTSFDSLWIYVFEIEQQIFDVYIPQLAQFIPITIKLALDVCNLDEDEHYDTEVHSIAMELVVTIFEIYYKEMKNVQDLQKYTFTTLMKWLCDVDDIPEWYTNEDEIEDSPYYFQAEEVIERITHMTGASNFVNFLIQHISLLTSKDWKQRLAFLTALNAAINSKKSSISKAAVDLCRLVFPLSSDENPRVRNQVLIFSNRIFKLYPNTQENIAESVLQIIGTGIADEIPRNQSKACDLATSLISSLTPQQLSPYLNNFIKVIAPLIESDDPGVVAEALCSLSNIILKMKVGIDDFFVQIIPMLQRVLEKTSDYTDLFEVKGRIIEMISIIATKLNDKYIGTCTQIIINEIQRVMNIPNLEISDPLFGYIETSFTRLADLLKDQCAPMLPTMIPIILKRVNLNIVSQCEYCETQKVYCGDEVLNVYIEEAEEKVNAITSIADLSNDLKNIFFPYVEQCLSSVIPLIGLKAYQRVRTAAVRCSVSLIGSFISGKEKETGDIQQAMIAATPYCSQITDAIIKNLITETAIEVISEQIIGLQRIIEANRLPLGKQQMNSILEVLKILLVNYIQQSELKDNNLKDEDSDEGNEEEGTFCFNYRSLLQTLATFMPQLFLEEFQNILLPILKASLTTNGVSLKVIGFVASIFSTIILFANQTSFIENIIGIIIKLASTKDVEILNQCMENILLLVQVPCIQPYLQQILEIIKIGLGLKDESEMLYNTSVMTLGKCICYNLQAFNKEIVLSWFSLLPIDSYPDDILSFLFTIFAHSQLIPLTKETITKTLLILISCLASKDSNHIRSVTKDLVTEQLKLWFQNNSALIEPIWEQTNQQQKELLNELLQ
ncbi:importin beta-3 subunit, putative [Entamoeba dispar SAW760]|uniref:Importin beta-3 subunit, putative n=1 Tax=Entamoeba dispar (strain ATCC PRA-260 / SAW760) TaxID=370354 RepID=B0ET87_ENTDS|nr:importin beta-3 subunit, putative [Entamoeba dispar SAW760]EDR22247.1 importin beta-3 subunit, putative [Entamoeba dispar SAW760]|eukprot:EDR22247.1 importin beta-3 subunit, putative [Entamoeba dispar SAW760]